ncbi:MAG: glycosyltransferase family 4 protein, partial [Pseudomonadales bacterium]
MKILTVHNRYQQPGGEDVVFAREAALLREYGHEVVEYVDDNKHIADHYRLTVALESVWSRPTYQRLSQLLLKLRPDIVHFHNTFVRISASAYAACRAAGVPVVQTLHNYRSVCPAATLFRQGQVCEDCVGTRLSWPSVRNGCYHGSRLQTAVVAGVLGVQRWYRTLSEPVDVYAVLTHFAKRKLVEGGLCADRIVVKPNFVADPGVRTQSVRTQMDKPALFVGRLVPEKGVRTLLRAWCNLKNIPLAIVGDGPLLTEAKTFIEQHQLHNVSLLGRYDAHEVIRLIKDAGCVLVPSECYEGFPLIIAEA